MVYSKLGGIKMKIPNLKELMISISELKKELSEIISKKMTKVIIKNNEPVSIIMPYSEYVKINENIEDNQKLLNEIGQDITLSNGVQIKVCVETGINKPFDEDIAIKTYIKMKTSGEYKLHYTLHLSPPSKEQTLTIEEQLKSYEMDAQKS